MTHEEKQLLIKDLSARLPYGVKYLVNFNGTKYIMTLKTSLPNSYGNWEFYNEKYSLCSNNFKPYLRSMSSMTEEEYKEYSKLWNLQDEFPTDADIRFKIDVFDWLNEHHFDYRGLIERGLAIAVTKENNPYKSISI